MVIRKAKENLLKTDPSTTPELEDNITFIEGDFFSTAWEAKLPFSASNGAKKQFDIIFDYTVSTMPTD